MSYRHPSEAMFQEVLRLELLDDEAKKEINKQFYGQ